MSLLKKIINKNPLFFAFLLPLFMDAFMTLYGQDASYWKDYSKVNEMAPIYILLVYSPLAYLVLEIFWFSLMYWLALKLKHPYNFIMALFFIIAHTYGSTGWVMSKLFHSDVYDGSREVITIFWVLMLLYILLMAVWSGYFLNIYFKKLYSKSK